MNDTDPKKANLDADTPAEDWHPADVIATLHKSGTTMMKLAKSHGLKSAQTFSKALRDSYPVAEQRIADALGLHPKDIWPSRYYANGEPKPRGYRAIQYKPDGDLGNGNGAEKINHEAA